MVLKAIEFVQCCVLQEHQIRYSRATQEQICTKAIYHICSSKFNLRIQSSHETCLEYVTALRALARKCYYPDDIFDDLVRARFGAGWGNDRLRDKLLLEPDELTLDQAFTIAQTFKRATTESSTTVARCNPSDSVQALGAMKAFKARRSSPSRGSPMRNNSQQRGRSPRRNSSPTRSGYGTRALQEVQNV